MACYVGSRTDRNNINSKWYRDGEGFFPAPLRLPTQLGSDEDEVRPDVTVEEHPVFSAFAGERNSYLKLALVDFYYALGDGWLASKDDSVQVIASLRNGAPLALEKKYGDGKVFLFLSKASPEETTQGRWNNFTSLPVFPIIAQELAGHLSSKWIKVEQRVVNDPIKLKLDDKKYAFNLAFEFPVQDGTDTQKMDAIPKDGVLNTELSKTVLSGIYTAELNLLSGKPEQRYFAINVPAKEGDLHKVTANEIKEGLQEVDYKLFKSSDFERRSIQQEGSIVSDTFLYILIFILVAEQFLAYLLSFHNKNTSAVT